MKETIDYSEMYPVVLSAMRRVKGDCTIHTNRRLSKTNCDLCITEAILTALQEHEENNA